MRGWLVGLVVLVLGFAFVFFAGSRRPRSDAKPRLESAASDAERPPAALVPAASSDEPKAEREASATPAPPSSLPALMASVPSASIEAPATTADLVVRARFVDERGAPIAGGRLVLHIRKGERSAEGGPDGEVALAFDRDGLRQGSLSFEGSAPGRTRRTKVVERRTLEGVSSYFLGEFVLEAGGALAGRVVDEAGAPIPFARILARPPKATTDPAERVFLPAWDTFADGIHIDGTSGADGSYRLDGVPLGSAEVLASDGRHLVGRSSVVEVRDAAPTSVADLVLRTAGPRDLISGWTRTAQGVPIAGVQVLLMSAFEEASYPSASSTDASGRFELLAASDIAFTLVAHEPVTLRRVRHRGAHAGDREIELVFGAPPTMEVLASDEAGPVARFSATAVDVGLRGLTTRAAEGGVARLELPDETLYVAVDESAHRPNRAGPFDPVHAPARIEVRLERAGGVAGLVYAGRAPAAGVEVHAHEAVEGASFGWMPSDFATFVEPFTSLRTRTDGEGRFFLRLQVGGRYRLHADVPGRARATSEWISVDEGESLDGFVLTSPEAGALAGRLLLAPGVETRGHWIGAGDGDGHVELAQTVDDGRFSIANLAPGRWQVRRVDPGQERHLQSNRAACWPAGEGFPPPSFDFEVRAGATTPVELDARDEVPCALEGRLAFGGSPAFGFTASLERVRGPLDAQGRFTLRAPKMVSHSLWIGNDSVHLSQPIDLSVAKNTWELDLPVGVVQLDNLPRVPHDPPDRDGVDRPEYALFWSRGELVWSAEIQEPEARSARLENVPAGALTLRWRGARADEKDARNWPALAELELAPGQALVLRLP